VENNNCVKVANTRIREGLGKNLPQKPKERRKRVDEIAKTIFEGCKVHQNLDGV